MRIRFQADADIRGRDRQGIRRLVPEIDFQTANEAEIEGVPDPEVLAKAADEERILVTNDRQTVPGHFADFFPHRRSPGVILLSKKNAYAAGFRGTNINLVGG